MSQTLCKNLRLSIEKHADSMNNEMVKMTLVDPINLTSVEEWYDVNITTQQSRKYHIKEAIVIGLRRLVDKGVQEGMINLSPTVSPGVSTNLNTFLDWEESLPKS